MSGIIGGSGHMTSGVVGKHPVVNVAFDSINNAETITSTDVSTEISGTQSSNTGYLVIHLTKNAYTSAVTYTLPTGWTHMNTMVMGYMVFDSSYNYTTNSNAYISTGTPAVVTFGAASAHYYKNHRMMLWKYK